MKSKPVKILIWLKFGHQAQNLATFYRVFFIDKLLKLGEMRGEMTELNYRKLC